MSAEYSDSFFRAFPICVWRRSFVGESIPGIMSDDFRTGMIPSMGVCMRFFSPSVALGTLTSSPGDVSSFRSEMPSALAIRSAFLMDGENRPFSRAHSCVTFMLALAASSFWRSPRAFRHMRTCAPMSNSDCDFICKMPFLSNARGKYIKNPLP